MKYFISFTTASLLGAVVACSAAQGADAFGAGRNGANGMADPWSPPNVVQPESRSDTSRAAGAMEVPLGAGRRGANGMTDPWYTNTGQQSSRLGAGDAPATADRAERDNSVPNGH